MPASCWGCEDWILAGGVTIDLPSTGETVAMHERCARTARRIFWRLAGDLEVGPRPRGDRDGED